MKNQHRSRRLALQGLCCIDLRGEKQWDLVEQFIRDSRESAAIVATALDILRDAMGDKSACDEILRRNAHRWELQRLALVDRNILRLATFELRRKDAPLGIVISEALKLAKEFSSAESPRFINGILDAIARELGDGSGAGEQAKSAGEDPAINSNETRDT